MNNLPPILVASRAPWASSGVGSKPVECDTCLFNPYSYGFVPDFVGSNAKIAIMFSYHEKDDANEREAMASDMGKFILRTYVYPAGIKKDELLITYLLRCVPKWNSKLKKPNYPTGRTRDNAEVSCRVFDNSHGEEGKLVSGGLRKFNPNICFITFNPREVFRVPAYHRQLQVDFKKALELSKQGMRPLVLCGNEPGELFAPWIKGKGSAKAWRGHFWEMDYKYGEFRNEGFIPA